MFVLTPVTATTSLFVGADGCCCALGRIEHRCDGARESRDAGGGGARDERSGR